MDLMNLWVFGRICVCPTSHRHAMGPRNTTRVKGPLDDSAASPPMTRAEFRGLSTMGDGQTGAPGIRVLGGEGSREVTLRYFEGSPDIKCLLFGS